jgi:hypothetical protein
VSGSDAKASRFLSFPFPPVSAPLRFLPTLKYILLTTFVWTSAHGVPASVAEAELPADLAALLAAQSAWSATANLQTGFGYKDNILLSHTDAEGSSYALGGVETLLWHRPRGRVDYFAFINADETRYFTSKTVDHEAEAFAQAEWRYRAGDVFKFALDGQGYYLDQIFDVSDTDVQRVVAVLKVTGVTFGPTLRWAPVSWWWIEAQGTGKREVYHDGINNCDVGEEVMRLGWRPCTRFEVSAAGTERRRDFDSRAQYDSGGHVLDGTLLKITEREGELRLDVTWDAAARWKTTTRAGTLHYYDNGSGFFNYHQRKLEQTLEWATDQWLVQLDGSARRLEFEEQTVGIGIYPPARIKEEFIAQLRVERKISARWTAFAEYDWERSRCNDPIASYLVRQELLGAKWSWEK